MLQTNDALITNGDMSGDLVSVPINVINQFSCVMQAVWTGVPVGVFSVEASCDVGLDAYGTGVTNWSLMTNSEIDAEGDSGDWLFRVFRVDERWIRFKYTSASGTGTLNVRFNIKGF